MKLELTHDRMGDFVLYGKDVGQIPVVPRGPQMAARGSVNQLTSDADTLPGLAHTALQKISHSKFFRRLFKAHRLSFVVKDEFRPTTKRLDIWERSVMMSSVIPSEKYSCSGSPLMLVKGRTAIDGRALERVAFGATVGLA